MILDMFLVPLALLYILVVSLLFLFGINFFYMTLVAWRRRSAKSPAISTLPGGASPQVTVQLPIYNEMYVAERVIEAATALDYPKELLQIQVLDDSTDDTAEIAALAVNRFRQRGFDISLHHRNDRRGYKAGALQEGLQEATGEFIAMFDADFVPPADFLQRVLPHFQENTAFVQARWGHLNRGYSLLTSLQAMAIDAHFMVEQFARSASGLWFNFNGTAGIWRLTALQDAGGWRADTLTEDLDLSYRALLKGWKGRYLREVVVPAELPASMTAFRRQQHRWARGSLECAQMLGPQVWQSTAPFWVKLSAMFHLTGYSIHLLLFGLSLLYPAILALADRYPQLLSLFGIAAVFNLTALAPTLFFLVGQNGRGRDWWRLLPKVLLISAVGSGLMINTVRATLQIFTNKRPVFERTAKFGLGVTRQGWMGKRYQLGLDRIVLWELLFAAMNIITAVLALGARNWAIAFYAALFATGLAYVSGLSIIQLLAVWRKQGRSEEAVVDLRLLPGGVKSGD